MSDGSGVQPARRFMWKNTYGKTGQAISVIGFGAMRFARPRDLDGSAEVVRHAHARGINYFDTAPFYCDDLSDEPGATRAAIERWRAELDEALAGRFTGHPVWPASHHAVRQFGIPHEYFREMIDGVASDLEPRRIETFDQLHRYCYQVASVVGLQG